MICQPGDGGFSQKQSGAYAIVHVVFHELLMTEPATADPLNFV